MFGLSPFVSRAVSEPQQVSSQGIEVGLDFMFWPRKDIGWYFATSDRTLAIGLSERPAFNAIDACP
jgi:hypothetical protein